MADEALKSELEVIEHEGQRFRLVHNLNAEGARDGSGLVELEQVVQYGNDKQVKFQGTGADYASFVAKVAEAKAAVDTVSAEKKLELAVAAKAEKKPAKDKE